MKALILGLLLTLFPHNATHPAADAGWTPPPVGAFKVIEYNIGSGSECGDPEPCLGLLEDEVVNYAPDVVLGTEFCYSDYLEFEAWLHSRPETALWKVEFAVRDPHKTPSSTATQPGDPDPHGLGCPDGNGDYEAKGNVLAGLIGTVYRYDIATPGYLTYTLLCGVMAAPVTAPTRACVTHLEAGPDNDDFRKNELRSIQNLKDGVTGNGVPWSRPLIGGDFNSNVDDAYWLRYLDDTMWTTLGTGTGAYAMTDPGPDHAVDHATYRVRSNMTGSARTIQTPDDGLSTHNLQESWVRY